MSDKVQPALTDLQWATCPRVYFRSPKTKRDEGYGVEINVGPLVSGEEGDLWVWDDSWSLTIGKQERHGLAALCLHGQPFGFTWEDVDAVLWAVDRLTDHASPILGAAGTPLHRVRETADRIAALLPPAGG